MGNLIIKPNTGGTLNLQDEGGTDAIAINTSGGVSGAAIKDEDTMGSNSATHLATQQSIKAYVDANSTADQAYTAARVGTATTAAQGVGTGNDVTHNKLTATTGVLFGTDTAAANTLDDYEEGTWTPADTGGNITASAGWYTKIGNLVTCTARIATGSGTTQNPLTGLPFNAKAINDPGGGVITSDSSGGANTWTVAMLNGAATIRTLKNNTVVTLVNSVTYDHITFSYYV